LAMRSVSIFQEEERKTMLPINAQCVPIMGTYLNVALKLNATIVANMDTQEKCA
jgi:hypothetical protein